MAFLKSRPVPAGSGPSPEALRIGEGIQGNSHSHRNRLRFLGLPEHFETQLAEITSLPEIEIDSGDPCKLFGTVRNVDLGDGAGTSEVFQGGILLDGSRIGMQGSWRDGVLLPGGTVSLVSSAVAGFWGLPRDADIVENRWLCMQVVNPDPASCETGSLTGDFRFGFGSEISWSGYLQNGAAHSFGTMRYVYLDPEYVSGEISVKWLQGRSQDEIEVILQDGKSFTGSIHNGLLEGEILLEDPVSGKGGFCQFRGGVPDKAGVAGLSGEFPWIRKLPDLCRFGTARVSGTPQCNLDFRVPDSWGLLLGPGEQSVAGWARDLQKAFPE